MVETNQTAGFWPNLYNPLRTFGTRIAEWLSPASDGPCDRGEYRQPV